MAICIPSAETPHAGTTPAATQPVPLEAYVSHNSKQEAYILKRLAITHTCFASEPSKRGTMNSKEFISHIVSSTLQSVTLLKFQVKQGMTVIRQTVLKQIQAWYKEHNGNLVTYTTAQPVLDDIRGNTAEHQANMFTLMPSFSITIQQYDPGALVKLYIPPTSRRFVSFFHLSPCLPISLASFAPFYRSRCGFHHHNSPICSYPGNGHRCEQPGINSGLGICATGRL